MRIGVLALQGDFDAHRQVLHCLGHEAPLVRKPEEMTGLAGLIIPGGESTTIWRMMEGSSLVCPIREFSAAGGAIFGTCAGAILCANEI